MTAWPKLIRKHIWKHLTDPSPLDLLLCFSFLTGSGWQNPGQQSLIISSWNGPFQNFIYMYMRPWGGWRGAKYRPSSAEASRRRKVVLQMLLKAYRKVNNILNVKDSFTVRTWNTSESRGGKIQNSFVILAYSYWPNFKKKWISFFITLIFEFWSTIKSQNDIKYTWKS